MLLAIRGVELTQDIPMDHLLLILPQCLTTDMTSLLCSIGQHIAANAEAYGMGAIAFVISAGKCMPKPGSSFSFGTLYAWLYDTVQSVLPLPRSSQVIGVPLANPIVPVNPAQTK